jgi:hypothetical protein
MTGPDNPLEVFVNSTASPSAGTLAGITLLNGDLSANSLEGMIFKGFDGGGVTRHGAAIVPGKEAH